MELDYLDKAVATSGEVACKFLGNIGLSRAGGAVDYCLSLAANSADPTFKDGHGEASVSRTGLKRVLGQGLSLFFLVC